MLSTILWNLRRSARVVLRDPGFLAVVAASLAVGIGGSVAVFSAIDTLLLRPLPYRDSEQLVQIFETNTQGARVGVALANAQDWELGNKSLDSVSVYLGRTFGLTVGGDEAPTVVYAGLVSADFFRVLRTDMTLGRGYSRNEGLTNARVAVISDALWSQLLSRDAGILSQRIWLNEEPFTVIGVLPPRFEYPIAGKVPQVYILIDRKVYGRSRMIRTLSGFGRLKEDVTMKAALADLRRVGSQLSESFPDTNAGFSVDIVGLHDSLRGMNREPLSKLAFASFLLLALACTNVAALLFARCLARTREIATRVALGGTPAVLLTEFLGEGLFVSILGTVGGFLLAYLFLKALPAFLSIIGGADPGVGWNASFAEVGANTFVFAAGVAALVTVVLSIAPTFFATRLDINNNLKLGGSSLIVRSLGTLPSQRVYVGAQIVLSVVLLSSSGLLFRSFLNVSAVDPGFDADGLLVFGLGLPESRYDNELKLISFNENLLEGLKSLPGVEAACMVTGLPMSGVNHAAGVNIAGREVNERDWSQTGIRVVSPGFFESLRIPLKEGRVFSWRDGSQAPLVTVVNQSFRKTFFPRKILLGRQIQLSWGSESIPGGSSWEIVGVVGDVRQLGLDQPSRPEVYLSTAQFPVDGGSYVVRFQAHTDATLTQPIADVVRGLDSQLERPKFRYMREVVAASLGRRRAALWFASAFATIGSLLAAAGLYGLLAYVAANRKDEMFLRVAIGASPNDLWRIVVGEGLKVTLPSALVGLVVSSFVATVLRSELFGVDRIDPVTGVGVLFIVVIVSLVAGTASFNTLRIAGRSKAKGWLYESPLR